MGPSALLVAHRFALASGIAWPGLEEVVAVPGASSELAREIEDAVLDQLAVWAAREQPPTTAPDPDGSARRPTRPSSELALELLPLMTASVLLAARPYALASGITWPGIEDILAVTGASPELAHELEDALLEQLAAWAVREPTLTSPPDPTGVEQLPEIVGITVEMIRFIKRHPGCAQSGARAWYADCFWRFVIELRGRHPDVTTAEFAAAVDLPLATVESWLGGGRCGVGSSTRAKYQRARRGARARVA